LIKIKLKLYKEKLYIYINLKYKVFVLFYINNMQVIFYKSNKPLANKIITKINAAYALYLIGEVKQFLGVCVIRN